MPIDRKALKQRMKEAKAAQREAVKLIRYPLPNLKGPGGNAFNLMGQAQHLMKKADIAQSVQADFHKEAMSGDYENVLRTIQEWFTLVVTDTSYVEVPKDFDVTSLINAGPEEWEDDVDEDDDPDLEQQLQNFEEKAGETVDDSERQKLIEARIRVELGLDPEDVVVIQIKRARKQES